MRPKPVQVRELARQDVEDAVDYYDRSAGAAVALGFIESLQLAYLALSEHPAAGSPRYAFELGLPGLRSCRVRRYPYLVFYVEREDHVDVLRVLHAHSDIPAWMREAEN